MKKYKGNINKMHTESTTPVNYMLPIGNELISMNNLIGKELEIVFNGVINCKSCGTKTKTSFGQGYCYPCFTTVPETAPCIIHPEKCEAHLGIYRDKKWADEVCLKPHYVYLAVSSGLKVGVTRATQIPTRWIDQGAVQAIKLAKTPNRNIAGLIEVSLKEYMSDKTSWQRMLKNEIDNTIDLKAEKDRTKNLLSDDFKKFVTYDKIPETFSYPVNKYPQKVKSINLDKNPYYKGVLTGIKGQYLIFEDNMVINIRKYSGYEIEFGVV